MIQDAQSQGRSHRLKSISIIGGFLDGLELDLSGGLNCLIGHRGTGKTTVLEFVRYALDEFPRDDGGLARKRVETIVRNNLGDGRIRLCIQTLDGLEYLVDRTAAGEPIVLSPDGKPTGISLPGGIFKADIYSQNEVENIADNPLSQLALIDNFVADQMETVNGQIRQVEADLTRSASHILPLQGELAKADDELKTLSRVEDQLKAMAVGSGQNAQEINQAHSHMAMRDRERKAMDAAAGWVGSFAQEARDFVGRFAGRVRTLYAQDMLDGPNGAVLQAAQRNLLVLGDGLDGLFRQMAKLVAEAQARLKSSAANLAAAHDQQEMTFRDLVQKHKVAQGQATERAGLERKRNDLLARKHRQEEMQTQLARLITDRQGLLNKLQTLRDGRFALRQGVAERITTEVSSPIRVRVEQCGNRELYQALLADGLKTAGIQHHVVARRIASGLTPAELADAVRREDSPVLEEKGELSPSQAARVIATLAPSPVLMQVEAVELVDLPRIELKDGQEYKDSLSLSTGQKCTTILPILLMESANPLMVDQPEDNLDNRFIFETVVGSVYKVKQRRQLILVTHNPNIPVLGEAEQVFVLTSDGAHAQKANQGTVDQCKAEIVNLLEGGEEAFIRRKERYNY